MSTLAALILSILAFALPAPASAQAVVPLDHLPILKGDYFPIESRATGRVYHIYVRLPADYAKAPETSYPIVYLTDGDALFPILAANHLFLHNEEKLPEAILVGIAYGSFDPEVNRRDIDYTPPAPAIAPERAGAPAFHDFLKSELLPLVERRYRVDPSRRILFGQSRGGSFVLYSAFTDPDLFWGRIASNPLIGPFHDLLYGKPAKGQRTDLGLVVASGSRDLPELRSGALAWFRAWEGRKDAPWSLNTLTVEGGTHAARAADVYRVAMLWLFGRAAPPPAR